MSLGRVFAFVLSGVCAVVVGTQPANAQKRNGLLTDAISTLTKASDAWAECLSDSASKLKRAMGAVYTPGCVACDARGA